MASFLLCGRQVCWREEYCHSASKVFVDALAVNMNSAACLRRLTISARAGLDAITHRHLSSSGQQKISDRFVQAYCCYATSRMVAMRKKPIAYSQKAGRTDGTMHSGPGGGITCALAPRSRRAV